MILDSYHQFVTYHHHHHHHHQHHHHHHHHHWHHHQHTIGLAAVEHTTLVTDIDIDNRLNYHHLSIDR